MKPSAHGPGAVRRLQCGVPSREVNLGRGPPDGGHEWAGVLEVEGGGNDTTGESGRPAGGRAVTHPARRAPSHTQDKDPDGRRENAQAMSPAPGGPVAEGRRPGPHVLSLSVTGHWSTRRSVEPRPGTPGTLSCAAPSLLSSPTKTLAETSSPWVRPRAQPSPVSPVRPRPPVKGHRPDTPQPGFPSPRASEAIDRPAAP